MITKAEMREHLNALIQSGKPFLPPPRPNTFEGVQFRNAIGLGLKHGLLEVLKADQAARAKARPSE